VSWFGLRGIELCGLVSNVVGVVAVAASSNVMGQYLSVPGIALATLGMALMYLGRASVRKS
jgi:hypothetical protein